MTGSDQDLEAIRACVHAELLVPVRDNVDWLAAEVAARHGDAVLGVLFYGSCLRKETDEGVLDYWVIVDDYRSAYRNWLHAGINPIAPPNVFFLERVRDGVALRTKYGVISRRAFDRGTSLGAWHPYIWSRFAQPARLLHCRDDEARTYFDRTISQAIVSFVGRLACHLPDRGGVLRFSLPAFWQEAFRRTYDSERRPEDDEWIRSIYLANERRYDAVGADALRHLATLGHFDETTEHPRSFALELSTGRLFRQRLRWRFMRVYARFLGLARLLKTAFTFGDWVPYVLFKLEKHTGRKIELTERQRKHPLLFAWPIILPLLRQRNLR